MVVFLPPPSVVGLVVRKSSRQSPWALGWGWGDSRLIPFLGLGDRVGFKVRKGIRKSQSGKVMSGQVKREAAPGVSLEKLEEAREDMWWHPRRQAQKQPLFPVWVPSPQSSFWAFSPSVIPTHHHHFEFSISLSPSGDSSFHSPHNQLFFLLSPHLFPSNFDSWTFGLCFL